MFKSTLKLLLVGLVVAAAVTAGATEADACWWGRGCGWGWGWGWGCGWGGWYSSCCYTPCYGYTIPCGYGWNCGYWGGYGCCYSCGYDPCCCSSVGWGGTVVGACDAVGPAVAPPAADEPTPAPPPKLPPTPAPEPGEVAPPAAKVAPPTRANSGLLTIWVPYEAKVYINDHETTTTGSRRKYVSYGLKPGLTYKYVIRAEVEREGELVEQTKTVHLAAGEREGVAFGFNPLPAEGLASTP